MEGGEKKPFLRSNVTLLIINGVPGEEKERERVETEREGVRDEGKRNWGRETGEGKCVIMEEKPVVRQGEGKCVIMEEKRVERQGGKVCDNG